MTETTRTYTIGLALAVLIVGAFGLYRYVSVQNLLRYWGADFYNADLWLHPTNQHLRAVALVTEHIGTVEGLVPDPSAPDTRILLSIRTDAAPGSISTAVLPTQVLGGAFYVLQDTRGQELVNYPGFLGNIRAGSRITLRFERDLETGISALTMGLITL